MNQTLLSQTRRAKIAAAVLVWLWCVPAVALTPKDLTRFKSEHYTIYTNLTREEAQPYGRHMDQTFAEYTRRFSDFRRRDRREMPLYLLRTRQEYLDLVASFGFDVSTSGGVFFYSEKGSGLATWIEGHEEEVVFETLQHEGFHQFAHAYIGQNLPVWVNEGLAEYFSDGLLVKGRMRLGMATEQRVRVVQDAIDKSRSIDFDQLLDLTSQQWHDNMENGNPRGYLQYHQSWSVVYFLIHGDNGRYRSAFEHYLRLVGGGRESGKAFRQAFAAKTTDAFRQKWGEYVQKLEPDALSTAVGRMEFLGHGLQYLRQHDQPVPATIKELQLVLQRLQFRMMKQVFGTQVTITAMNDAVYGYWLPNGGQGWFQLLEPEARGLLPRIAAPGLKPEPTLVWTADQSGRLQFVIRYK